jgi:hypothetical protein
MHGLQIPPIHDADSAEYTTQYNQPLFVMNSWHVWKRIESAVYTQVCRVVCLVH